MLGRRAPERGIVEAFSVDVPGTVVRRVVVGELIVEVVGWVADSLMGDALERRRQRRARRRLDEGFLRCEVTMVSGKIGGLTREGAAVELELLEGAVVCRRRDDRTRAIHLRDVTLDPTSARSFHSGDPVTSADDDKPVRWRLSTPTATLQVVAAGALLRGAYARVHPEQPAVRLG